MRSGLVTVLSFILDGKTLAHFNKIIRTVILQMIATVLMASGASEPHYYFGRILEVGAEIIRIKVCDDNGKDFGIEERIPLKDFDRTVDIRGNKIRVTTYVTIDGKSFLVQGNFVTITKNWRDWDTYRQLRILCSNNIKNLYEFELGKIDSVYSDPGGHRVFHYFVVEGVNRGAGVTYTIWAEYMGYLIYDARTKSRPEYDAIKNTISGLYVKTMRSCELLNGQVAECAKVYFGNTLDEVRAAQF